MDYYELEKLKDKLIYNIGDIADQCNQKIHNISQQLCHYEGKMRKLMEFRPSDRYHYYLKQLENGKKKVYSLIDEYFLKLEKDIGTYLHSSVSDSLMEQEYNQIYQQISKLQAKLEKYTENVKIKEICLQTMLNILDPKFDLDLQEISQKVQHFSEQSRGLGIEMYVNFTGLEGILSILKKNIYIIEKRSENREQQQQQPQQPLDIKFQTPTQKKKVEDSYLTQSKLGTTTPSKLSTTAPSTARKLIWSESPKKKFVPQENIVLLSSLDVSPVDLPKSYDIRDSPQLELEYLESDNEIPFIDPKGTPGTFDADATAIVLHFFQDNSKKLHIMDIKKAQARGVYRFEEIDLDINFKIPMWHRSVISRKGRIYLTGGCESNFNESDTFLFDPTKNTLKPLSKLNYPRNSHGICIFQNHIYVVGGCGNEGGYTNHCERLKTTDFYNQTLLTDFILGTVLV